MPIGLSILSQRSANFKFEASIKKKSD
jgi:hypothetical protein